ncbi:MAG: hypothetical protein JW922_03375 [Paludibacteraceae bacterium]|nr:hypothetical protein [Paludibacteraceae bacterium]
MKKALFILLIALILSNVFFINTSINVIGDGGDSYEFLGFMHLAKENILAFKHPFAPTDTLRYPNGFDFSYGYDGAFAVLSGALISIFTSPILAFNLTIVLILFLNIYISYYFYEKIGSLLGKRRNLEAKAIIAALIFGASPYVFARLNSHLNLAFVAGFPMFLYYVTLLYKKVTESENESSQQITQWDINLFFSSVLLIAMGSLQYLLMLTTTFLLLLVFVQDPLFYKKTVDYLKKNIKEFIVGGIYFIIAFIYLFGGYLTAILRQAFIFANPVDKFFKPGILDYIIPNSYLGEVWSLLNHSAPSIERVISIGTIEILLFIILLIKVKSKRTRIFSAVLLAFYILVSSGVVILPYLPEGGRFVILISLFIGYLLVSRDDWFKSHVAFPFILTMVLAERLFFSMRVSEPVGAGILYEKVRGLPGTAVLNIPLTKYNAYRSALPVFYNKKVLDGYFHYTAGTQKSEAFFAHRLYSRFVCQDETPVTAVYDYDELDRIDFINSLKADDIGVLVLFKDDAVGKYYHAGCDNVKDWWSWLEPETFVVSKDTDDVKKKTFEITVYSPHTIARVFFERKGKFLINGLYVSPKVFEDTVIVLPDRTEIPVELIDQSEGSQVEYDPPIEVNVNAGDMIYIKSPYRQDQNRYIDVFYYFEADRKVLERAKMPLEQIYESDMLEIYKVN